MAREVPCCVLFRPGGQPKAPADVINPRLLVRPSRAVLDPYVSHLGLTGRRGEVWLVDLETQEILIRRQVA